MRRMLAPAGMLIVAIGVSIVLGQGVQRPAGWSDATRGDKTAPDYACLFAMDKVHEIRITIPADRFRAMQDDLASITPAAGAGRGRFGPPAGPGGPQDMAAMMQATAEACVGKAAAAPCSAVGADGQCTALFGGPLMCVPEGFAKVAHGGAINLTTRDPMYVPVTVTYEGRTWTRVGMRYKGNSSLASASASGNGRMPFRLDFDQYANDFPEIDNQRFYGFKKLTFSSNFTDDTQIREVIATERLRDRGVPAPRAAFYRVMVDTGSGPAYWGLYSMIEDPADGAMLDTQLGGRKGNLYKPDGPGANWASFDEAGFEKKNNKTPASFSDVSGAIAALHAPRTSPQAWRQALEAKLDVNLFLRWLAVNTVMETGTHTA